MFYYVFVSFFCVIHLAKQDVFCVRGCSKRTKQSKYCVPKIMPNNKSRWGNFCKILFHIAGARNSYFHYSINSIWNKISLFQPTVQEAWLPIPSPLELP